MPTDEVAAESITFVFWNVNRQDRRDLIGMLAAEKRADIVVLAEHWVDSDAMRDSLRRHVDDSFMVPRSETPRLQIFSRNLGLDLREVYGDASGRVSMRLLRYCDQEFLFAAAHLPSKINMDRIEQASRAQILSDQIRKEEDRFGHRRTILVGDLNMNPFEDGIVMATGLHGMMTKATAMARSRIVGAVEYPFFYNPMWGFFGDRTAGPPGTYHYRSGLASYDWNIFDQVLLRPDALPWFHDEIEIVTKIGETELTYASGRPNKEIASDHFPIVFRLAPNE